MQPDMGVTVVLVTREDTQRRALAHGLLSTMYFFPDRSGPSKAISAERRRPRGRTERTEYARTRESESDRLGPRWAAPPGTGGVRRPRVEAWLFRSQEPAAARGCGAARSGRPVAGAHIRRRVRHARDRRRASLAARLRRRRRLRTRPWDSLCNDRVAHRSNSRVLPR